MNETISTWRIPSASSKIEITYFMESWSNAEIKRTGHSHEVNPHSERFLCPLRRSGEQDGMVGRTFLRSDQRTLSPKHAFTLVCEDVPRRCDGQCLQFMVRLTCRVPMKRQSLRFWNDKYIHRGPIWKVTSRKERRKGLPTVYPTIQGSSEKQT